jgi:outer membrane protein assembly factor BamB
MVMAFDRKNGRLVWEREARQEVPHEGTHRDGSWAPGSAVTDGEHLFAFFGSRGLYAYTMDGTLVWETDLGDMTTRNAFGEGSSPALDGESLVLNWDHEGDSFITALDKRTGKPRWRRERNEVTSWSTPIIVEHGGKKQVVVNATGRVRGYDLENGETIWEVGGMTVNAIPSPIHRNGIVYVTSGFRGSAFKAIRLAQARGDVADGSKESAAVAWSYDRDTPYVPSPLLYGDALYFMKVNTNILTNLDPDSGQVNFGPERLEGIDGVYASPVGAAERVYVVGRNGTTVVLRRGKVLEILATNMLDDGFDASPAIAGDELFLRGKSHLYCIAED